MISGDDKQPLEQEEAPTAQTDSPRQWNWVAGCVWTVRMLEALINGVKGGKWYSLMDKIWTRRTLWTAWEKVASNKGAAGVDRQSVEMFEQRAEQELEQIARELQENRYRPRPVRRTWIPKPGSPEKRPLGIPTVRDRVVQTGVKYALEPIFEKEFAEQSYGFRPGRSCKDALRRVSALLEQGNLWIVDADLKSYFDTIDHQKLMRRVEEKIADGRLLGLIRRYLEQGIMEDMNYWVPEQGTPQGAIVSPLLANVFLNPLDHMLARQGMEMVRYADDFVILCPSLEQAEKALKLVQEWTEEQGLTLHPEKTRIVDGNVKGGFDFLGYHFDVDGKRWPRKKSVQKFRETIRGRTRRTNGNSMECIIEQINPVLRGWYGYFKHSVKGTFKALDGWVRMRLRSILRKRSKRKGGGRGADHQRWPNAYFAEAGLYSMYEARRRDAHSAQAVNH